MLVKLEKKVTKLKIIANFSVSVILPVGLYIFLKSKYVVDYF